MVMAMRGMLSMDRFEMYQWRFLVTFTTPRRRCHEGSLWPRMDIIINSDIVEGVYEENVPQSTGQAFQSPEPLGRY
jgi:hypothetical protein